MAVIKSLVFITPRGVKETFLFVASLLITFPTALSYFHPAMVRIIFLHVVAMVRIIRRLEK